jgi:protein O-mannosyl-transferase
MHPENNHQIVVASAIHTRTKLLLGCAVIIVGCFIAYTPAIRGGFIWDDDRYVTANHLILAPDGLWRIWFSTDSPSQYFPLTYTMFWFEYRIWGFNPTPYHIANVAIHIINSLLLWLVLRRLSIPAAFTAAAIFALHPVNVESVAWITERKNVLMLFFSLLSILFWLDFSLHTQTIKRATALYLFSLLFYALALSSKTTACVLPAVLLLVSWLKNVPVNKKQLLLIAPYIALGLTMGLLTIWWEHYHQGTGLINLGLSPLERILIATRAVWFYAAKIFFPLNLAFSYHRWDINTAEPLQYTGLLACLLTTGGVWFWRKSLGRGVIAAILMFVVTLFPTLGFFDLYTFVFSWVADHYQYMASIAVITLATAAASQAIARLGSRVVKFAPLLATVILLTCATLTWRQSRIYTNIETLWRDTLKKNPDSWLAHNNLGQVLFAQGKTDELIYHLTRANELVKYIPSMHPYNIASTHYNLALAYESLNKYEDAINHLRIAIDIYPDDLQPHLDLAYLLESHGRLDEAVIQYKQAIQISPDVISYYRLANAFIKQDNISDAIVNLHLALNTRPDYIPALDTLISIFVMYDNLDIRRQTKAIEYARLTVDNTNRNNPLALNLLARAYASDGQFTYAVAVAEEALKIATSTGATNLADSIREQLEFYKKQLK